MSTRNLDALFAPQTIALVGASNQAGSVGQVLARNLFSGGFKGAIWPVNPHEAQILGHACYSTIGDLPAKADLAVIATPANTIPALIDALGQNGCRAAIVISAGAGLRDAVLKAGETFLMRIVGPNCLGLLSPGLGLNASFAHLHPEHGDIAFLTQSGAIATSMLDWANGRGLGFSHIVSLGDMGDVDFGDLLDYLALDRATRSILLYVENITQARKFMSAARIAARAKPVIVVKAGRGAAGARAAASHTGALAGSDAVYDAAFRRAGMLRVDTLRDLFDTAETLASGARVRGERLTVLTNGGGLGVLAADALEAGGGQLSALSSAAIEQLNAVLPAAWSHNNPIDILGDARPERYRDALCILSAQPDQDAILVMNCPTGVADSAANAEPILAAQAGKPATPLLACWMGGATAAPIRERLSNAGIANYETPDEAVRAFLHLAEYARNQQALLETPEPLPELASAARAGAKAIIEGVLAEGRSLLTELEAKAVLEAYGVPIVKTVRADDVEAAARAAHEIGGAVALKILSRDITHKSDVGGVALDLSGADEVKRAGQAIERAVRTAAPKARLDGFTVQTMIRRPHAHELIVGMSVDDVFGPVLLFGQGGVAVEVLADRVMGLPPLNSALAHGVIARTRVAKLLAGYRDRAPADCAAVARALVAVSDMILDLPQIRELDINPLLADHEGVIALDARIVIGAGPANAAMRLAIKPYPGELRRELEIKDGDRFIIRPIRPEDAPALQEMTRRTDPADLRLRFHGAVHALDAAAAARLSQIDYDRELALVALAGDASMAGVGRLVFDPDFVRAEYALIVRNDVQGRGIGRALLGDILAYARAGGAQCVWGDVLSDNHEMLTLAQALGATLRRLDGAPELTRSEFRMAGVGA